MVVADFQICGMCPILNEAVYIMLSASRSIGGAALRCRYWIPSLPGDVLDACLSILRMSSGVISWVYSSCPWSSSSETSSCGW